LERENSGSGYEKLWGGSGEAQIVAVDSKSVSAYTACGMFLGLTEQSDWCRVAYVFNVKDV
jgi:hypothetical protein